MNALPPGTSASRAVKIRSSAASSVTLANTRAATQAPEPAAPPPLAQSKPVSGGKAWSDIPACKASGVDIDYQMLRGVFLPNGASPEQATFYIELLRGVLERQEWHDHIAQGGLDARFLTGPAFDAWLERTDTLHAGWMREAGLLHEPGPPN